MTGLIETRDDDDEEVANLYSDSGADPIEEDLDQGDDEESAVGEEDDGEEEGGLDAP